MFFCIGEEPQERFERVEFGAGSWGARLKEARAVRRERGPRWEPWEFTISLGSPMQTACIKTIVFLFINQAVDQVRMFVF